MEWALIEKGGGVDNGEVEKTGRRKTNDNTCDNSIDEVEVVGGGITKEK